MAMVIKTKGKDGRGPQSLSGEQSGEPRSIVFPCLPDISQSAIHSFTERTHDAAHFGAAAVKKGMMLRMGTTLSAGEAA